MLLTGLKDPSRLMRTAFGMCVATIAQRDWPEQWPDLFDHLVAAINSGHATHVLGAVRCMSLFCDFLDDLMVPKLAPSLFPALSRVFSDDTTFGPETRRYACTVMKTCVVLLGALRDSPESPAFVAISGALQGWLDPLMGALSVQATQRQHAWRQQSLGAVTAGNTGAAVAEDLDLCLGYGVQIEALQTVTVVVQELYGLIGDDTIRRIFMAIWRYTEQLIPAFASRVINASESGSVDSDNQSIHDREGNSVGLEVLMVQVFEFLNMTAVVPSQTVSQLVSQGLPQIFRSCAVVMQMSDEQVEKWGRSSDGGDAGNDDSGGGGMEGLEDDGGGLGSFGISGELHTRNVAACLVDELAETFDSLALRAAASAVAWGVQQTDQALAAGGGGGISASWWKPLEAVLMVAGIISSAVERASHDAAGSALFDAAGITSIAMRYVQQGGGVGAAASSSASSSSASASSPVLLSRCIWLLGRFAWALTGQNQAQAVFQAAVAALAATQPLPVRISACRALSSLSSQMAKQEQALAQSQSTLRMAAVQGVCVLLSDPDLSPDVLPAIVGALAELLEDNAQTACDAEPHLTPALVQVWSRHASNPHLCGAIVEVFQSIAAAPSALPGLQSRLLPTLCSLVSGHATNLPGIVEYALDLMAVISRHAPLAPAFVSMALPPVLQFMHVSSDNAGLASGAVCLSALVYAGADAMVGMSGGQIGAGGGGAVPAILNVILRLLAPDVVPEMGALGAGGLVTQVVLKLQAVLDPAAVQKIFHSVLVRLASAKYSALKQSLVMVFARLMHRDMSTVMRVVGSLPAILDPAKGANVPAFALLAEQWVAEQPAFTGKFQVKVSLLALARLFKAHAQVCAQITVQGDLVVDVTEKRRTRSQGRRKLQYASVPLSLRIMQLLLRSVDELGEDDAAGADGGFGTGMGMGGAAGQGGGGAASRMGATGIFAAADDFEEFMLSDSGAGFWGEEEEDDGDDMLGAGVDAKDDPLYAVDLQEELSKWFKGLPAQELSSLNGALTNAEDREKLGLVTSR